MIEAGALLFVALLVGVGAWRIHVLIGRAFDAGFECGQKAEYERWRVWIEARARSKWPLPEVLDEMDDFEPEAEARIDRLIREELNK